MSTDSPAFSFRSVVVSAYLPTLLFSTGEGALIPLLPAAATNLGVSLAIAGVISAMLTIGELVGDIPSGVLVSRIGERTAMIGAIILALASLGVIILAGNGWVLGFGVFLLGLATAVFSLARHAFMTSYVPLRYRARALSVLGGVFRGGWFIGPLISAPIIHFTGGMQAAFWVMVFFCLAAAAVLLIVPDPTAIIRKAGLAQRHELSAIDADTAEAKKPASLFRTIWSSRQVLARVGVGAAILSALRSGRIVLLPLWAVSIGLGEASTALIIGLTGALDFALFYTSGQVMDRFGRVFAAVPATAGLGLGMLVLAFTHDVTNPVFWFCVAAVVLSVANGLSSGIVMTLGADLADPKDPAPFLGAWRFTIDAGSASSPLLIAAITGAASISLAAGAMGLLGFAGAWMLAYVIPRYVPHSRRDSGG